MPDPQQPQPQSLSLDDFERQVSQKFGIPDELRQAMTGVESGGNTSAVSPKGARGKYQVMDDTLRDASRRWGVQLDNNNPFDNAYAGLRYLKEQYDALGKQQFANENARWLAAVSRYHGGGVDSQGNVRRISDGSVTTDQHVDRVARRWSQIAQQGSSKLPPPPETPQVSPPPKPQSAPQQPSAPVAVPQLIPAHRPTVPQRNNAQTPFSLGQDDSASILSDLQHYEQMSAPPAPVGMRVFSRNGKRVQGNIQARPEQAAEIAAQLQAEAQAIEAEKQRAREQRYQQMSGPAKYLENIRLGLARAGGGVAQAGANALNAISPTGTGGIPLQVFLDAQNREIAAREAAAPELSARITRGVSQAGGEMAKVLPLMIMTGGTSLPAQMLAGGAINAGASFAQADPRQSLAETAKQTTLAGAGGALGPVVGKLAGAIPGETLLAEAARRTTAAGLNVAQGAGTRALLGEQAFTPESVAGDIAAGVAFPAGSKAERQEHQYNRFNKYVNEFEQRAQARQAQAQTAATEGAAPKVPAGSIRLLGEGEKAAEGERVTRIRRGNDLVAVAHPEGMDKATVAAALAEKMDPVNRVFEDDLAHEHFQRVVNGDTSTAAIRDLRAAAGRLGLKPGEINEVIRQAQGMEIEGREERTQRSVRPERGIVTGGEYQRVESDNPMLSEAQPREIPVDIRTGTTPQQAKVQAREQAKAEKRVLSEALKVGDVEGIRAGINSFRSRYNQAVAEGDPSAAQQHYETAINSLRALAARTPGREKVSVQAEIAALRQQHKDFRASLDEDQETVPTRPAVQSNRSPDQTVPTQEASRTKPVTVQESQTPPNVQEPAQPAARMADKPVNQTAQPETVRYNAPRETQEAVTAKPTEQIPPPLAGKIPEYPESPQITRRDVPDVESQNVKSPVVPEPQQPKSNTGKAQEGRFSRYQVVDLLKSQGLSDTEAKAKVRSMSPSEIKERLDALNDAIEGGAGEDIAYQTQTGERDRIRQIRRNEAAEPGPYGMHNNQFFQGQERSVYGNNEIRAALGLDSMPKWGPKGTPENKAYNAALQETREALRRELNYPRNSHISPEEVRQWARAKGVSGRTLRNVTEAADIATGRANNKARSEVQAEEAAPAPKSPVDETPPRAVSRETVSPVSAGEQPDIPDFSTPTRKKPARARSLTDFVIREGGLKRTDYNRGDLDNLVGREGGRVGLLNRNGIEADLMRQQANEAGYGPFETVDDFVQALYGESRGAKHFSSAGEFDHEAAYRQEEQVLQDQGYSSFGTFDKFLNDAESVKAYNRVSSGDVSNAAIRELRRAARKHGLTENDLAAIIADGQRAATERTASTPVQDNPQSRQTAEEPPVARAAEPASEKNTPETSAAKPAAKKSSVKAGALDTSEVTVTDSGRQSLGATADTDSNKLRLTGPAEDYRETFVRWNNPPEGVEFTHQAHYGREKNILFDYRTETRQTDQGENATFLMEAQSDWAQSREQKADNPLRNTWLREAVSHAAEKARREGRDGLLLLRTPEQVAEVQRWGRLTERDGKYFTPNGYDVTPIVRRYTKEMPREASRLGKLETRKVEVADGQTEELFYLPLKKPAPQAENARVTAESPADKLRALRQQSDERLSRAERLTGPKQKVEGKTWVNPEAETMLNDPALQARLNALKRKQGGFIRFGGQKKVSAPEDVDLNKTLRSLNEHLEKVEYKNDADRQRYEQKAYDLFDKLTEAYDADDGAKVVKYDHQLVQHMASRDRTVRQWGGDLSGLSYALKFAGDMIGLRNTLNIALRNPKKFLEANLKGLDSAINRDSYYTNSADLRQMPKYDEAQQRGLFLTTNSRKYIGLETNQFEETLGGRLVDRTWVLGNIERGNRITTDIARLSIYDDLTSGKMPDFSGSDTPARGKRPGRTGQEQYEEAVAAFANALTGRGNLHQMLGANSAALRLLTAPRYMYSYVDQFVQAARVLKMNPAAAPKVATYLLGRMASVALMHGAAAALLGGTINTDDPESPDFLKVKIGDNRYDFSGGAIPYYRLGMRLWKISTAADRPQQARTREAYRAIFDFVKARLGPVQRAGVDINKEAGISSRQGLDSIVGTVADIFTPVNIGNFAKNVANYDLKEGAKHLALNTAGINSDIYETMKQPVPALTQGPVAEEYRRLDVNPARVRQAAAGVPQDPAALRYLRREGEFEQSPVVSRLQGRPKPAIESAENFSGRVRQADEMFRQMGQELISNPDYQALEDKYKRAALTQLATGIEKATKSEDAPVDVSRILFNVIRQRERAPEREQRDFSRLKPEIRRVREAQPHR